jgi:hypothetical protein
MPRSAVPHYRPQQQKERSKEFEFHGFVSAEQFCSPTGRNCPLFTDRSVNKEKPDREVRNSGQMVHGRDASPSMMAIQGETPECGGEWRRSGWSEIGGTGASGTRAFHVMEEDHRRLMAAPAATRRTAVSGTAYRRLAERSPAAQ